MKNRTRRLTHGALIAALYVGLCYLQNILVPESATMAIQFRVAEALCVLAFFTPAAIPGLAIGCLLFNVSFAMAAGGMYLSRNATVRGYPVTGMLMPALSNAFLVGWELSVYIGGGFWFNALCVAIGEAAVLLTLGSMLYYALKSRKLHIRLFGE